MRSAFCLFAMMVMFTGYSQNVSQRLDLSIQKLSADSQLKHAMLSIYIVETKTGRMVFEKNPEVGLAPASCQKVVTSVTAFELLGKNYRYKTLLAYDGSIEKNVLKGFVHVMGNGDPTLASWRYRSAKEDIILSQFAAEIRKLGIKRIDGGIKTADAWGPQIIPDGWIWQDIGNYYGAGASSLNWRENQYDLILKSGNKIGDKVSIVSIVPFNLPLVFEGEIFSAARGTGDNAYIYMAPRTSRGYLSGTIPVNEERFTISGSMPDPGAQLARSLMHEMNPGQQNRPDSIYRGVPKVFYTHTSPPLDSINYWFLKKSINLYGEALVKTIGLEKAEQPLTDTGMAIIRNFWYARGIEKSAMKIIDGSGLSPGNRITTKALVTVMQYAKKQPWFSSFNYALPDLNGMKMKDGYINGVRSYTGYVRSKSGTEYTFSFIINNFDGSVVKIREKMWAVLDMLK